MENETGKTRINPLLECSETIFSLTSVFKKGDHGATLEADYREKILSGFDIMERMAFERQIGMVILKDAKYALAAYIDEAVLSSSWPGRLQWMSRPLQMELFGDHLAGEGFFERLTQLRQGGEANLDLLELFYACLQLGFEGIYKLRGLEQLMALQVDLRAQIEGYRGVVNPNLSPEGVPAAPLMARVRREVPYWVVTVVTVAVVFFTYLGYSVAVNKLADRSVVSIQADQDAMLGFLSSQAPAAVKAAAGVSNPQDSGSIK